MPASPAVLATIMRLATMIVPAHSLRQVVGMSNHPRSAWPLCSVYGIGGSSETLVSTAEGRTGELGSTVTPASSCDDSRVVVARDTSGVVSSPMLAKGDSTTLQLAWVQCTLAAAIAVNAASKGSLACLRSMVQLITRPRKLLCACVWDCTTMGW